MRSENHKRAREGSDVPRRVRPAQSRRVEIKHRLLSPTSLRFALTEVILCFLPSLLNKDVAKGGPLTPKNAWENSRALLAFACTCHDALDAVRESSVIFFANPSPLRPPRYTDALQELQRHLLRCRSPGTSSTAPKIVGTKHLLAARQALAAVGALAVLEETCATRGTIVTAPAMEALCSFLRPAHVAARLEVANTTYISNPAGRGVFVVATAPALRILSRHGWIGCLVATSVVCHAHEVLERVKGNIQRKPQGTAVFETGVARYAHIAKRMAGTLDNNAVVAATAALKRRMGAIGTANSHEVGFARDAVASALLAIGLALTASCSFADLVAMSTIVDQWRNNISPDQGMRIAFLTPFALPDPA